MFLSLVLALCLQDSSIESLVDDLGHDKAAQREEATHRLRKIGAKALPILEKYKCSLDAEVRSRVALLLADIELNRLLSQHLRPNNAITLKADKVPFNDLTATLSKASGVRFEGPTLKVPVTASWTETPFIQMLDELAAASGTSWLYQDDGSVYFRTADIKVEPSIYVDGFKIYLSRLDTYKSNTFSADDGQQIIWLYFGAVTDPGVKSVGFPVITVVSAIDDHDGIIEFDGPNQVTTIDSLKKYTSSPFTANRLSNKNTKSIKLIRGAVSFTFPLETQEMEIKPNPEEGNVTVDDITIMPSWNGSQIQITVTKPSENLIQHHIDLKSIVLIGPDGPISSDLVTVGLTTMAFDAVRIDVTAVTEDSEAYEGPMPLDIKSVKFKLHKKLHVKSIPFEFRNIEIP